MTRRSSLIPTLAPTLASSLALAALLPAAASAQPGRFELAPMAAYRLVGDLDVDDTELFDESLEIDESEAFGIAFDIPLGSYLQLELLANRQDTELTADGGLFGSDTVLADIEISYYHVGLLWQFLDGQVNPYIVGSIGLARLAADLPGTDEEDRPSLSFGGGVKIFWSEHVGVRLEGRGYYVVLDEDDDGDRRRHDRWENEESLSQAEAAVGLILAW
jgi:hypothetical protein